MRPLVCLLLLTLSGAAHADIAPPRIRMPAQFGQGHRETPEEAAAREAAEAQAAEQAAQEAATAEAAERAEAAEAEAAATHDALRALKSRMQDALNAQNLDGLLEHVTEDVVFTTMNGDVVRGPDEVRAYFARMMEGEEKVVESLSASFEADDLSILVRPDVALAFGQTDDHYTLSDGTSMDIAARWTATLVRDEGDEWKVQAFHYSTNMFDNPVLEAQRSVLIMVMILGGLAIFALAFWIGRKLGRRAGTRAAKPTAEATS